MPAGILFGVTTCCPNQFVTINPATAELTPLSVIGDATFAFHGGGVVNPTTHQVFLQRSKGPSQIRIITIDIRTGAVVEESLVLDRGVFSLGFDPAETPGKVGGTTSFLTDGSGTSFGGLTALAGSAAVAFVIMVVGGLYARRRRLGRRL